MSVPQSSSASMSPLEILYDSIQHIITMGGDDSATVLSTAISRLPTDSLTTLSSQLVAVAASHFSAPDSSVTSDREVIPDSDEDDQASPTPIFTGARTVIRRRFRPLVVQLQKNAVRMSTTLIPESSSNPRSSLHGDFDNLSLASSSSNNLNLNPLNLRLFGTENLNVSVGPRAANPSSQEASNPTSADSRPDLSDTARMDTSDDLQAHDEACIAPLRSQDGPGRDHGSEVTEPQDPPTNSDAHVGDRPNMDESNDGREETGSSPGSSRGSRLLYFRNPVSPRNKKGRPASSGGAKTAVLDSLANPSGYSASGTYYTHNPHRV